MINRPDTRSQRIKRHKRVRAKIAGTPERPRLNVFRSETNIYAQIIDDTKGITLVSASSLEKGFECEGTKTDAAKKVYVASFTGTGENEDVLDALVAEFEAKGYTVVDDEEEADIAYLDVQPTYNLSTNGGNSLGVLDLVEELEMPERINNTQEIAADGSTVEVTTIEDVNDIAKIAEAVHANGGKVIASIKVTQPWILTNLEPYCDALIANFGVAQKPQIDVVTGAYNPTGKLPITMVSSNEVIAVEWKTLEDGNSYEICASPNDVPGYDKDQYIDPAILEKVPGGSYAYCDSEGNYYRAWFGLSY